MITHIPARPGLTFEAFGSLKPGTKHVYIARVMEHWAGDPSQDVFKCQHKHPTEGSAAECAVEMAKRMADEDMRAYENQPSVEEQMAAMVAAITGEFAPMGVERIEFADEDGTVRTAIDLTGKGTK